LKISEFIFYTGCGVVGGWLVLEVYKYLMEEQAEEISILKRKVRQLSVSSKNQFNNYDSKLLELEKNRSQTDKLGTVKKKRKIK
jgi:hypothetical protein